MPKRGCLLPFPNDVAQTKADKRTPTGRRVRFTSRRDAGEQGRRGASTRREWNRNDGFTPGPADHRPRPVAEDAGRVHALGDRPGQRPRAYKAGKQPLLLLDEKTGKRQIVWGELDANADVPTTSRNLIIHPAKNLVPGRRYVVVLRGLKRQGAARACGTRPRPALRKALRKAKVKQHERLPHLGLHRRQRQVADRAPADDPRRRVRAARRPQPGRRHDPGQRAGYTITSVQDFTPGAGRAASRARITGTFTVPCYLDQPGCPPGARLHYSSSKPDALPTQIPGNVHQAPFQCNIPRAALGTPSRISLYGHGLLGNAHADRRGQHPGHERGARLHVLRDRLERDGQPRTSRTRSRSCRTSRSSRRWPTACSRASSTRSTSAACSPTRRASRPTRLPGRRRAAAARHVEPVLRLQLAGRDPRRPGHRGGARLDAARCSAWRRWTTARCCRARSTSTPTSRLRAGLPGRGHST